MSQLQQVCHVLFHLLILMHFHIAHALFKGKKCKFVASRFMFQLHFTACQIHRKTRDFACLTLPEICVCQRRSLARSGNRKVRTHTYTFYFSHDLWKLSASNACYKLFRINTQQETHCITRSHPYILHGK